VEASYVANRGAWEQTNLSDPNGLSRARLASFGLDPWDNAADRTLLTGTLTSAAAVARGFNKPPYPGFALTNTVAQSLRPFPQFNGGLTTRWAPQGDSWYQSLQTKLTKRFSHGLDATAAFTWSKTELTNLISDPANRALLKGLDGGADIPLILNIGFNYELPKVTSSKLVRQLVGGWTLGGIMLYQSGSLIGAPSSNTIINQYTFTGGTRMNRVPGAPLYLKNLNCGCIDPYHQLVLNPAAWVDVPEGTYSQSAQYFDDYRGARRPSEQFSLGRRFGMEKVKAGMFFEIRAEFFNAFNRLQLANPSSGNTTTGVTHAANGNLTGGYGFINPLSGAAAPRNGQLVARIQF